MENRVEGPHGVTFCQHRLDASKGVFVPNPVRVFNKLAAGPIKKDNEIQRQKFRQRKGAALLAYLQAYPDMPFIHNLVDLLEIRDDLPDYEVVRERYETSHPGLDYGLWGYDVAAMECTLA